MRFSWIGVVGLSFALWLGLSGCSDDSGMTTDSGTGGDTGTGGDGGDAGDGGTMDPMTPPVQVGRGLRGNMEPDIFYLDPAMAMAADFSCRGMPTAPTDGASIDFNLEIRDFQDDVPVEGACVKVYDDNMVPDDTCDPASDPVTDDMGLTQVSASADGFYAYRVFPKDGPTPSRTIVSVLEYNNPAPSMADEQQEGNSVSAQTISLIPIVLGFGRVEGSAIIAGTVNDCNNDEVFGTLVRVYTASGELIREGALNDDPHYRYFDGEESFPSPNQPWSHHDGLYAVANVPIPADNQPMVVEFWGRLTADGPLELLGCESGRILADAVTILNMGPLRADGPTCPGMSQ